jgi:disulfide bond formation protein DsbB
VDTVAGQRYGRGSMQKHLPSRGVDRRAAGFFIAAVAAATLAGAWYFELVLGLAPCPLCLDQRIPYYVAVPFALVLGAAARGETSRELRSGFLALAILLAFGAALGVYHAGIEWKWWPGPTTCAGGGPIAPPADILSSLKQPTRFVACDQAAWRFLGISLAGYNALIAGALGLVALWAARQTSFRGAGEAPEPGIHNR